MQYRKMLAASVLVGAAVFVTSAHAQQKTLQEQLVGTWKMVSTTSTDKDGKVTNEWGENPLGVYMFQPNGQFVQIFLRSDLPKTQSRGEGTPLNDRAIVAGSLAMFGTYTVNEAQKAVELKIEGSSFAATNGTAGRRNIRSLEGDELRFSNPATSEGRTSMSIWKRAK